MTLQHLHEKFAHYMLYGSPKAQAMRRYTFHKVDNFANEPPSFPGAAVFSQQKTKPSRSLWTDVFVSGQQGACLLVFGAVDVSGLARRCALSRGRSRMQSPSRGDGWLRMRM